MKTHRTSTFLAAFLLVNCVAKAAYVSGVGATTTMGSGFSTNLNNTVNGVGLSSPSLTATHAGTLPTNSWVSSQGVLTGTITFNLGQLYLLEGFSFWNQNGGGPGLLGITGIQGVQVSSSLDGTLFASLTGAPSSFAKVMGSTNLPPEIFSFPPIAATHVRFSVLSNYGDESQTGFGEVAFNGTTITQGVPDGGTTFMLLGPTLAALGAARRFLKR
jgi:hypothetical protein